MAQRMAHGFTTIVKTCGCGDEMVSIVLGDARLPGETRIEP
jgi:hypothetical protein